MTDFLGDALRAAIGDKRAKAIHKEKFTANLPPDFQERILSGELYIDQDEETGLCAIYPSTGESK